MSDDQTKTSPPSPEAPPSSPPEENFAEGDVPRLGDDTLKRLLKKSLAAPLETPPPDLVSGVQRKLRKRSRGKFYADGWSTTSSKVSYALVAVAMLLFVAIAYLVLGPTGISVR